MTYWIADICSNWGGDLSRAKFLIDSAVASGFDSVKVQFLNPAAMYLDKQRQERLNRCAMTLEQLEQLYKHTEQYGEITLGASVFAPEDVIEVGARSDYLKIASAESQWNPLIEAVAMSGEDWMISTPPGWAKPECWDDIHSRGLGAICRLHCVPIYPCPPELACLCGIEATDGYSDHTRSIRVVTDAVVLWGCRQVELHWAVDVAPWAHKQPEALHSWSPQRFSQLLNSVAEARTCEGDQGVLDYVSGDFWAQRARDPHTGYRRG